MHFISLDTVNPNGYDDGSLDQAQYAWLQANADDRALARTGKAVRGHRHRTALIDEPTRIVDTGGDARPATAGRRPCRQPAAATRT